MQTLPYFLVLGFALWGPQQQHPDFFSWSPPVAVDQSDLPAITPRVAVAPKGAPNEGTIFVAWRQEYYDSSYASLFATAIHPALGASAPVPLDSYTGEVYDFDLAAGADGGAWVVFQQPITLNVYSIFAAPYTAVSGWGSSIFLEYGAGDAQGARIAAGPEGGYTAVFVQKVGGIYRLMGCRHEAGGAWNLPLTIDEPIPGYAPFEPALAVSPDGTTTVVFQMGQSDYPYGSQIFATQYKPGAGWDPNPALVDPGYAINPSVAAGAEGTVMTVFRKNSYLVHFSSLSPGGSWTPAAPLETGYDSADPQIASGPHGVFHAVWAKIFFDAGQFGIAASRYDPASGWQAEPVAVDPLVGFGSFHPRLAVSDSGTAAVLWDFGPELGSSDNAEIQSNFLAAGENWEPAKTQMLASGVFGFGGGPQIAAFPDEGFVAVWSQYSEHEGYPNIFLSRMTRR